MLAQLSVFLGWKTSKTPGTCGLRRKRRLGIHLRASLGPKPSALKPQTLFHTTITLINKSPIPIPSSMLMVWEFYQVYADRGWYGDAWTTVGSLASTPG